MKIFDHTLLPYEINIDANNFTVEENTGKLNKENESIYRNHGYYSSLLSAISKVISLKLHAIDESLTLKEYIHKYEQIKDEIKASINF